MPWPRRSVLPCQPPDAEVFAHVIAGAPNGLMVEWMDWTSVLFEGLPVLADGALQLSERRGHGLTLSESGVRKSESTERNHDEQQ